MLSATVLTRWVALPKMFCNWYRTGAETNCGIARILGMHLTDEQLGHVDIFFSNCYNLQSVYFELNGLGANFQ